MLLFYAAISGLFIVSQQNDTITVAPFCRIVIIFNGGFSVFKPVFVNFSLDILRSSHSLPLSQRNIVCTVSKRVIYGRQ